MPMDELITWLKAQIDDDERLAQRAGASHPRWSYDRETFTVSSGAYPIAAGKDRRGTPINDVDGEHIARHDPARVLADVAAKRAIVDLHSPHNHGACPTCWRTSPRSSMREDFPCRTLRLLATAYADSPGWREEWRA